MNDIQDVLRLETHFMNEKMISFIEKALENH